MKRLLIVLVLAGTLLVPAQASAKFFNCGNVSHRNIAVVKVRADYGCPIAMKTARLWRRKVMTRGTNCTFWQCRSRQFACTVDYFGRTVANRVFRAGIQCRRGDVHLKWVAIQYVRN